MTWRPILVCAPIDDAGADDRAFAEQGGRRDVRRRMQTVANAMPALATWSVKRLRCVVPMPQTASCVSASSGDVVDPMDGSVVERLFAPRSIEVLDEPDHVVTRGGRDVGDLDCEESCRARGGGRRALTQQLPGRLARRHDAVDVLVRELGVQRERQQLAVQALGHG